MGFISTLAQSLFVLNGPPSAAKGLINGVLFNLYAALILFLLL